MVELCTYINRHFQQCSSRETHKFPQVKGAFNLIVILFFKDRENW